MTLVNTQGEVEGDSEYRLHIEYTGQLMFGIAVPVVPVLEVQRRGVLNMTREHFNRVHWALEDGDSMSVKVKDGRWLVAVKKAWEEG